MTSETPPKLFLSYAHGSQEHEGRVVDLGEKLRHNGVDVIADFWDLRAGHDLHKFMEQMASEVGKVLIVSDKNYAQKADGRQGGVGAESEIIAPNLIGKSDQEKFAALVIEKDDGKFCLPAYMRSRVCIDCTDPNKQPEVFEKILRWVFDKPLLQKPALGSQPSFALGEDSGIATPSLARVSEVCAAIESNQGNAMMRAEEFVEEFARDIAQYQVPVPPDGDHHVFVDKIDESIRALLAPRNAALEVVSRIIRFVESDESVRVLRRLFESLYRLTIPKVDVSTWEFETDNIRFLINEIFIYAVSIALKHEKFDFVAELLDSPFYIDQSEDLALDNPRVDYGAFSVQLESLDLINGKRGLNRLSLQADYLKERCNSRFSTFRGLLQADFVLHLCGEFRKRKWRPRTLPYQFSSWPRPYEIFVRAESGNYFRRMATLFGGVEGVRALIKRIRANNHSLAHEDFRRNRFHPLALMNDDALIALINRL